VSDAVASAEPAEPAADATAPVQLSPYQRRKAREAERERDRADRKAKREARAAAGDAAAPAEAEAPKVEPLDEKRAAKVGAVFVRFMRRVAAILVFPFGGAVEPFTDEEVAEQAQHLVAYFDAFRGFYRVVTWLAWPALFLDLVASHFKRRPKETK
jgi:hypothetical protein